jgi:myo-inositol-1(or 4)-monophosphatase
VASFLETAVEVARDAGALIAESLERRATREKSFELKGEHDLVTETDRASERLIFDRLHSVYPTHAIVAEEGSEAKGSSEYRWHIDPLDGTTNFTHGFPVFNVSIGLEKAGEIIAGVIVDPTRNEVFTAEAGGGAYLNFRRIHVSNVARLDDSLAGTGFPSRNRHRDVNVHFYYQLAMVSHGVRRAGAAALDLAYVACGRLDLFWEFSLKPWDMAAGTLLVREAGGTVTDMRGETFHLRSPHVLADNGLVHAETVALFGEVFAGRYPTPLPRM